MKNENKHLSTSVLRPKMRPQSWSNPIFLAFSSIMKGSQEAACRCWRLPSWWITSPKNLRWKVACHDKSPWPKIHPPDLPLSETESVSLLYITHFECIPMFSSWVVITGHHIKTTQFYTWWFMCFMADCYMCLALLLCYFRDDSWANGGQHPSQLDGYDKQSFLESVIL